MCVCEHICLAGLKKTRSISHMSTTDQCVWKSCANNKQTVQTVVFLLKCRIFFFLLDICLVSVALPVIRTAARRPAHLSCINACAPQRPRVQRERTWWKRALIIPLINPPPPRNRPSSAPTASRFTPPAPEGKTPR